MNLESYDKMYCEQGQYIINMYIRLICCIFKYFYINNLLNIIYIGKNKFFGKICKIYY